jgi:hypothetical protein
LTGRLVTNGIFLTASRKTWSVLLVHQPYEHRNANAKKGHAHQNAKDESHVSVFQLSQSGACAAETLGTQKRPANEAGEQLTHDADAKLTEIIVDGLNSVLAQHRLAARTRTALDSARWGNAVSQLLEGACAPKHRSMSRRAGGANDRADTNDGHD